MIQIEPVLQKKLNCCREILRRLRRVAVAFSGGVDSTFLLAMAVETLGCDNVLAVIGVSPILPGRQRTEAIKLARDIGAELVEVETAEMSDPNFTANPTDRCFHCKMEIFSRLAELAHRRGFDTIISGANADDPDDFRPGLKAEKQLGVRQPLMEASLTKENIRTVSRAMGLKTWNKPSSPCLASRIPYGLPVTTEKLARIEQAEEILFDSGFTQCRLRDHNTIARIEVLQSDIPRLVKLGEKIIPQIKKLGYKYVTLDLEGFRSGSLNE